MAKEKLVWHPWAKETFERAAEEGKLILLDISAVWCHWCHVMDSTTYEDERVIKLLNDNCLCVRVDVDKEPEIVDRYNTGGYPTTAFLTNDGRFIDGGTFIPADLFVTALTKLVKHIEDTQTIQASDIFAQHLRRLNGVPIASKLDPKAPHILFDQLKQQFDPVNGGFGHDQKFPMPDLVRLCWIQNSKDANVMAEMSLKSMLKLHDDVEGGFFRYATKPNWTEPHYEKMLELNAQLLRLYAEAFTKTKNPAYKHVVDMTLKYLLSTLKQKQAFGGSQNADEAYYKEKPRRKKAPSVDPVIYTDRNAQAIVALLHVDGEKAQRAALDALDFLIKHLVEDTTVYHYLEKNTPHNSGLLIDYVHLISALIEAAERTEKASYLELADKLAKYVIDNFSDDRGGFKDRIQSADDVGHLKAPLFPIVQNALMAENLDRLAKLKKQTEYAQYAKKALLRFGNSFPAFHVYAAPYVLAVKQVLG